MDKLSLPQGAAALLVIDNMQVLLRLNNGLIIFAHPMPCHLAAILPKGVEFALIFYSRQADSNCAAVLPTQRYIVDDAPVAHVSYLALGSLKSIPGPFAVGPVLADNTRKAEVRITTSRAERQLTRKPSALGRRRLALIPSAAQRPANLVRLD